MKCLLLKTHFLLFLFQQRKPIDHSAAIAMEHRVDLLEAAGLAVNQSQMFMSDRDAIAVASMYRAFQHDRPKGISLVVRVVDCSIEGDAGGLQAVCAIAAELA